MNAERDPQTRPNTHPTTGNAALHDVAAFLNHELAIEETPDYPGAVNGLQFANSGSISNVAVAVDASLNTIEEAAHINANLLIVHHGLFWSGVQPVTGLVYRKYKTLLDNDIALYSAHLPLDLHSSYGNNTRLAAALGLTPASGFAQYRNISIGVQGENHLPTDELTQRVTAFAAQYGGNVRTSVPTSGRTTRKWAICTGGGASSETIAEAVAAGVDTLITGEGPHHTTVSAIELDLCIIYAGHYATETLGVQAVGELLNTTYGLPWSFLRLPTGS